MALSSQPFAGVGVTYRHHEEAKAEGQHDGVQHEMLLCTVTDGADEGFPSLSDSEVPPHAFDFEAGATAKI
jgi:hypothetical protein